MIEYFIYFSVLLNFAVLAALCGVWVHVQIQGCLDGGYRSWRHLVFLGCLFVFFTPGYLHLAFSMSYLVGILAVVGAGLVCVVFAFSTVVTHYQHREYDMGTFKRGANVALKDED